MEGEIIKKVVKQKTITNIVDDGIEIIPDYSAFYNFKILLSKKEKDLGFFDGVRTINPCIGFNISDINITKEISEPIGTTTPPIDTTIGTTTPPIDTTIGITRPAPVTCFSSSDVQEFNVFSGVGDNELIGGTLEESLAITILPDTEFDFSNGNITSVNYQLLVDNSGINQSPPDNVTSVTSQDSPFKGIFVNFDGTLTSGDYQLTFQTTTDCVATITFRYNFFTGLFTSPIPQ